MKPGGRLLELRFVSIAKKVVVKTTEVFPVNIFSLTLFFPYLSSGLLSIQFPTEKEKGRTKSSRRLNMSGINSLRIAVLYGQTQILTCLFKLSLHLPVLCYCEFNNYVQVFYLVSWPHTQNWHHAATILDSSTNCSEGVKVFLPLWTAKGTHTI